MKFSFRFSVSATALAIAFVFAGLSAHAENIATAASSAGKATITLVKGRVTDGALANAFNGSHGWAANYCLLTASEEGFTLPSEETPIIIDYVIADDFRPGEDIIASRFVIWGINNKWSDYYSSAAKWYEIYGSNDGETWTKIIENKPMSDDSMEYGSRFLTPAGANSSNSLIVPWKNRASYRRYRFKFIANDGYTDTTRGQLFIQDINIMSDNVIHVSPDGSNDADGSSWESATTPTNAVRLANLADYTEIHCKAGRYTLPAACVYTKRIIQIGGFSGNPEKPLEMDLTGARSIYDGNGVIAYGFHDNTSAGNYVYGQFDYVENMEFCNMTVAGLRKTGSQGIECRNCRFVSNRTATGARGVYVDGQQQSYVSKSRYLFRDCDFSGNGLTTGNTLLSSAVYGYGIGANNGRLYLDNCTFVSNGVPAEISQYVGEKSYCPQGSALYASATTLNAVRCKFIRNRGFTGRGHNNNIQGGACVYVTAGSSGVTKPVSIHGCEFTGNEDISTSYGIGSKLGGLTIDGGANSTNEVVNCTFAYNISDGTAASAGLTISSGLTAVSNSVFYGNKLGTSGTVGADIHLSGGKLIAGHTLFTSPSSVTAATAENLVLGEGVIYGDPQFVTSTEEFNSSLATTGRLHFDVEKYAETLAFDVHLKTPSGYRKNGTDEWFTDALIASPAIDAGDPASGFSNEPVPNGGRINLGCYGNTAEASKTPPEASFEIAEIPVQFFDGVNACTPIPTLVDKTTGEALDAGDFEFSYINNNAYGTATITVTGREGTVNAGLKVSATFKIAACFRVTALSLETEGDGKSWESPMSLTNAIANAVRKEDVILVKAGVYPVTATISVPNPVTIRGGYAGTTGDQLADNPETVLDGENSFDKTLMAITASTDSLDEVVIENFAFVRSNKRGLLKSGITSLKLLSCRIDSNSHTSGEDDSNGIGARFSGNVGFTEVTMSNCVVRANQDATAKWMNLYGHGVYAVNLKSLNLIDTSFVSNGIAPASAYNIKSSFGYNVRGFAVYATSAPIVASGCEFRLNRGYSQYPEGTRYKYGGIVCVEGAGGGSSFDHCLFAGNSVCNAGEGNGPGNMDGTLYMSLDSVNSRACVNHCTFFGNIADTVGGTAGAYFGSGTFALSNSVFAASIVGSYAENGADVYLASGKLSISHCFFGGSSAAFVSAANGATLTYEGGSGDIIYGNPRTVTPIEDVLEMLAGTATKSFPQCASPLYFKTDAANLAAVLGLDAHLLSGAGYRKNGSSEWFTDVKAVSYAIDAADSSSPFNREAAPNGGRANLGCYGNTPEASKSATGKPEISSDIQVTYPDGYSQPLIEFNLGGNDAYCATVTVRVYTNENVLVGTYIKYDAVIGEHIDYLLPLYLPQGTTFKVVVSADAAGGSSVKDAEANVTAALPPWNGRGGPKNVIHVRPNATGRGTGENWTDAMTDFHAALKALSADRNEIWLAGTNVCVNTYKTISLPTAAIIRGGFSGFENSIAERPAGIKAVVDGKRQIHTMDVTTASPLLIERIRFVNSRAQGVSKSGAGDLTLSDCEIEGCGMRLGVAYGYGLSASGDDSVSVCTITNCVFAGNGIPHESLNYPKANSSGLGFGASFRNFVRVTIDGSLFITNGVPFSQPNTNTHGYQQAGGSAIYAENAPITARECRFICNRAWCGGNGGGTVRLLAGTGSSAFTNCLYLANQNSEAGYQNYNTGGGGEIYFDPASTEATLDIMHCTFAGNLNDIRHSGGGGLNIRSGSAHVINSIFYGTVIPRPSGECGKDVYVAAGASLTAEYSLFSTATAASVCVGEGAEFIRGSGLIYGSPQFVSPVDDLRFMPIEGQSIISYPAAAFEFLSSLDVHLRGKVGYLNVERGVRVRALGVQSPAIDAGHPLSSYSREPDKSWGYSGRRANLGCYGNTPEATATRYPGLVIYVGAGGAIAREPVKDDLPTVTIGGGTTDGKPLGLEDILICDQADQSIKIMRGTDVIWRWKGAEDPTLPKDMLSSFSGNPTECKVLGGGKYIAMAASGWAIIDVATTNAIAYGKGKGSPHSIDLLPNDVVVVASTDTWKWTDQGVYFYDISGNRKTSPDSQNCTYFYMDNPHGFYWDEVEKRLYISDTQGLHCCIYGYDGTTFTFEVERTWNIAELGLTYGHDLRVVPGTRILSMSTYEQVIFFDMDAKEWKKDMALWRKDAKAFDPHRDGVHFLVTVPKAGFDPSWVTDTIETYSTTEGFKTYLTLPGSKIYKARWFKTAQSER